jgi:hypothetical protein
MCPGCISYMSGQDPKVYGSSVASAIQVHSSVRSLLLISGNKRKGIMTMWLPCHSVHAKFRENQSCDSKTKMCIRVHMAW